jgi:hypothetical protein
MVTVLLNAGVSETETPARLERKKIMGIVRVASIAAEAARL